MNLSVVALNKLPMFLSECMPELIEADDPQFELLNSRRFEDFLRARNLHVNQQDLEHYEQIGFLYPVLRLRRPLANASSRHRYAGIGESAWEFKRYMQNRMLEFPTSKNFRPWKEYKDGYEENTMIYYHPYQVFMVHRFLTLSEFTIKSIFLETATECGRAFENMKKFHQRFKESFLKARPLIVTQIALLLRLQNAYQPDYRGRVQLSPSFEEKF